MESVDYHGRMARLSWALLLPLLLACGPRRPAGVPREAVQVGEGRAAAWLLLGEREGGRWRLRAWSRDGALQADGAFALQGMARASIEPHELAAWDGRQAALKDGTLLVPAP